jgi:sulfate/thiosulfate transport system ATP-binding protein
VLFGGEDVLARPIQDRRVGFVFQNYALFRHMTVFENIAFGLRVRPRTTRLRENRIRARVEELLELVQLGGYGERFPAQLSGGQRQRVALARALAIEPKLLLLDEPFGALDTKVRVELRRWLRDLHDRTGITTVFVTHDQEEALDLADRIAIMQKGRIEQVGTPNEIYERPASPFVYEFLGAANRFECEISGGEAIIGDKRFPMEGGARDGPAVAYVRPHDILIWPMGSVPRSADATVSKPARICFISALGAKAAVELVYEGRLIEAEIPRDVLDESALTVGSRCAMQLRLPCVFPSSERQEAARGRQRGMRPTL